jgi:predicted nucleotidyltransferase
MDGDKDIEAYNKPEKKLMKQDKKVVEFLSKQECVKLAYLFGSVAKSSPKNKVAKFIR